MAEESVGPKTEPKTEPKSDPKTKDKKSEGTPDKKSKKKEAETPTHEGQKRVTDDYRAGWKRIWQGTG